jgi:chaperonin GroEL
VDIVRKALRTPLSTIAKNAGADSSIVVQKVMSSDNPSEGYDALKDKYVDMIHEGTILLLYAVCWMYKISHVI